jgi:hypothetical protein
MVRAVWEDALGQFFCILSRAIHRFFHRWDIGSVKDNGTPRSSNDVAERFYSTPLWGGSVGKLSKSSKNASLELSKFKQLCPMVGKAVVVGTSENSSSSRKSPTKKSRK